MRTQTMIKEATEAADRGKFDRGFVYAIAALAQAVADGMSQIDVEIGSVASAIGEVAQTIGSK
jgi:hypothetical protein